jgi:hypothetical protein
VADPADVEPQMRLEPPQNLMMRSGHHRRGQIIFAERHGYEKTWNKWKFRSRNGVNRGVKCSISIRAY